jgi:hypothetical protein
MHSLSHHEGPATLSNIAVELRCHILGFLSYREIIRCALVSPQTIHSLGFSPSNVRICRFEDLSGNV